MRQVILAAALSAACLYPTAAVAQAAAPVRTADRAFAKDLERGYRLKEAKRSAEAIAVFAAIVKKDPGNHAALTELGYLNAGLKRYTTAVKYLTIASEQDPENMHLRMDLAYAAQSAKKPALAAEQFAVVAAKPGEYQAAAQAAVAAVGVQAAPVDGNQVEHRRIMEQGYAALNRGEKATAAKAFEAAVVNDPTDAAPLKQLGFLDLDAGRVEAAAKRFEAARVLQPTDDFVALQLGYTYERLQQKDRAREMFTAASASSDEKIRVAAQAALQSSGGAGQPAASTSL
jgi:tetratricopeptide (TPR) repeat protein